MHIFYFIFVQFKQFPVLRLGLTHSGSHAALQLESVLLISLTCVEIELGSKPQTLSRASFTSSCTQTDRQTDRHEMTYFVRDFLGQQHPISNNYNVWCHQLYRTTATPPPLAYTHTLTSVELLSTKGFMKLTTSLQRSHRLCLGALECFGDCAYKISKRNLGLIRIIHAVQVDGFLYQNL